MDCTPSSRVCGTGGGGFTSKGPDRQVAELDGGYVGVDLEANAGRSQHIVWPAIGNGGGQAVDSEMNAGALAGEPGRSPGFDVRRQGRNAGDVDAVCPCLAAGLSQQL
jgi:hypothetical protein